MTDTSMLATMTLDLAGTIQPPIFRPPDEAGHKHDRGHVAVLSGPVLSTGAARLSAQSALVIGAGLVTIYGQKEALHEHAAHVTAIMLADEAALFSDEGRKVDACVIGPGHGGDEHTRLLVLDTLKRGGPIVLDADALTAFQDDPEQLFGHCHGSAVLAPHAGEFARLFGKFDHYDRDGACCGASERTGAVVVLKGKETVIAGPRNRFARNVHASSWLATAGSGDVLAGMIAALLGQGLEAFSASCAAVWLHGDIGLRGGAGLTAERMIDLLPGILADRIPDD